MAHPPAEQALRLVSGTLATWRLTHLLVEEDGPGQLIGRLRTAVDRTPLVGLLDCFGCASVWVGAAVGLAAFARRGRPGEVVADVVVGSLTLSGAAFVLHKVLSGLEAPTEPTWLAEPTVDSPWVTVTPD